MIGPEGAAELAAAWLEARIPYRLAALEARLDLDAGSIGVPALVLPYDRLRLGVEEYPAILVVAQGLPRLGPVDVNHAGDSYRATYRLRVYAWVRDVDEQLTDLRRKRYALAIREAFLERLTMSAPPPLPASGGNPAPRIATDALSLSESYSDIVVDDAGATIAGAWVEVDVTIEERLEAAPLELDGSPAVEREPVELVGVDVTALPRDTASLPPHPAL